MQMPPVPTPSQFSSASHPLFGTEPGALNSLRIELQSPPEEPPSPEPGIPEVELFCGLGICVIEGEGDA